MFIYVVKRDSIEICIQFLKRLDDVFVDIFTMILFNLFYKNNPSFTSSVGLLRLLSPYNLA